MNTFMNQLKATTNYGYTENGALKHNTTTSAVLDMFALGGAYRKRSDEDCILLFKNAFDEDPTLAMKCLFYLRDVRGGQGERRFFRTAYRWLCQNNYTIAERNLEQIPEFGRWDDLIYITEGTGLEIPAFTLIQSQLFIDKQSRTPSLLAKWMPSQNASNKETKRLGHKLADFLGMTDREYRKTLSSLREKIKVLETLMSQNRWDEIEFDKIPSKAGLIYKNAFAHKEVTAARYEAFMKSKETKVNAGTLYPYEIVAKALNRRGYWGWEDDVSDVDRQALEKYWNNLPDYFADASNSKMMCVVDTSGSMTGSSASAPINVAISLGMYAAERAGGPFKDHYISFSRTPQLIKIEGIDFVDKVRRIYRTNLCENTNLSAVFDLLLAIADRPNVREEDIPNHLVIVSDMEIDSATASSWYSRSDGWTKYNIETAMESIRSKWTAHGHKMPKLTYWNVDARNNTILDAGPNVSFVSGMSPSIFTQVMTGKSAWDLMIETLMSERYKRVTA